MKMNPIFPRSASYVNGRTNVAYSFIVVLVIVRTPSVLLNKKKIKKVGSII